MQQLVKKAQQRLFFLRKLQTAGVSPQLPSNLCTAIIGSVPCLNVTVWCGILFGDVCLQFEDHMLTICMKILNLNPKHAEDPAADVAARSDATYVSRVVSAMVNLTHCPL